MPGCAQSAAIQCGARGTTPLHGSQSVLPQVYCPPRGARFHPRPRPGAGGGRSARYGHHLPVPSTSRRNLGDECRLRPLSVSRIYADLASTRVPEVASHDEGARVAALRFAWSEDGCHPGPSPRPANLTLTTTPAGYEVAATVAFRPELRDGADTARLPGEMLMPVPPGCSTLPDSGRARIDSHPAWPLALICWRPRLPHHGLDGAAPGRPSWSPMWEMGRARAPMSSRRGC